MDSGSLVSDEIVIALIEERSPRNTSAPGFIFDGFPRTVAQAEALDAMLASHGKQIDRVVRLEVDPQKLLDRVAKRFAEEGRADDNPESFKVRLDAYLAQTAPLVPYYETQGKDARRRWHGRHRGRGPSPSPPRSTRARSSAPAHAGARSSPRTSRPNPSAGRRKFSSVISPSTIRPSRKLR